MSLLVPNLAEKQALEILLNKRLPDDLVLCLFKNNKTPADADVLADYTEADFTGYAAAPLTPASWTVTAGAPTEATYPEETFTSSAGSQSQNVYGYYVKENNTDNVLRWAERFSDGPYQIVNNGDVIKVTPVFQGRKVGE